MSKTNEITNKRLYGFDSLRAIMMLLGLVIHSAISYMTMPTSEWPYKDSATSPIFDMILVFIHIFRMPVFFVMAGFFVALLIQKRGVVSTIRNRIQRIFVPFVVGWIVIYPLAEIGAYYAKLTDQQNIIGELVNYISHFRDKKRGFSVGK